CLVVQVGGRVIGFFAERDAKYNFAKAQYKMESIPELRNNQKSPPEQGWLSVLYSKANSIFCEWGTATACSHSTLGAFISRFDIFGLARAAGGHKCQQDQCS